MLKAIFTLDYEIHGNGDGCPYALMVEPTERMLRQFDAYGAKLTILADIAEILKFRQYAEEFGRDDYHYFKIIGQLRDAIRRGHDVQLHIHASYFNAKFEEGRWRQDWSEYDFAGLKPERLREIVRQGKEFLESLLRPVNPHYRCSVFRAANWSVSPSKNVVRALVENGFTIDTSIFKYGRRDGLVNFDYTNACSGLVPWRAAEEDLCAADAGGKLFEFPIYSENRWVGAFLTPQRIYRACVGRLHRFSGSRENIPSNPAAQPPRNAPKKSHWLGRKHAWKADFNQCSGRQLIRALERAETQYGTPGVELPFVLIGHSKLFTGFNEWSLRSFLAFVKANPDRFGFGKFCDFDLQSFGDTQKSARPEREPATPNGAPGQPEPALQN
jgi:hypothetical protein